MNLATPGKPVEITKEDALDQIIAAAAILDEAAEPRPFTVQITLHRFLDKRQRRRMLRNMARKNGRRVACFSAESGSSPLTPPQAVV